MGRKSESAYSIENMKGRNKEMTEELIKDLKRVKKCLANKEMIGEEWEEKQEMIKKLEEVTTYLKDALGQGIEF